MHDKALGLERSHLFLANDLLSLSSKQSPERPQGRCSFAMTADARFNGRAHYAPVSGRSCLDPRSCLVLLFFITPTLCNNNPFDGTMLPVPICAPPG